MVINDYLHSRRKSLPHTAAVFSQNKRRHGRGIVHAAMPINCIHPPWRSG
jgi:hypothetical protein